LFRSINKETFTESLTEDYVNKLGFKYFGDTWIIKSRNKQLNEKLVFIKNHINKYLSDLLDMSGYYELEKQLSSTINEMLYNSMYSKINYCTKKQAFAQKFNFITTLNDTFKHTFWSEKISQYLDDYLSYLEEKYAFNVISDIKTHNRVARLFKQLNRLFKIELTKEDDHKVRNFIDRYNVMLADYEINILKNNEIKSGEIMTLLLKIEKTTNGFDKLKECIECLNKVPIEDYFVMVQYLKDNGFNMQKLMQLFTYTFVSFCNNSVYSGMIKNYLTGLYLETNDVFLNFLSCKIQSNIIVVAEEYNCNKYKELLKYLLQLINFYNPDMKFE
jgi:hypothetical protein